MKTKSKFISFKPFESNECTELKKRRNDYKNYFKERKTTLRYKI